MSSPIDPVDEHREKQSWNEPPQTQRLFCRLYCRLWIGLWNCSKRDRSCTWSYYGRRGVDQIGDTSGKKVADTLTFANQEPTESRWVHAIVTDNPSQNGNHHRRGHAHQVRYDTRPKTAGSPYCTDDRRPIAA